MRFLQLCRLQQHRLYSSTSRRLSRPLPIIQIKNATFYKQYPTEDEQRSHIAATRNPPIFANLDFSLPSNGSSTEGRQFWSILSSSSLARTTFLQVLNGQFISVPPTARSYPYLTSPAIKDKRLYSPNHAIKYVGFDAERSGLGNGGLQGAYLSARYESRKEETDFTLHNYLTGRTELNALEKSDDEIDQDLLARVVKDLKLTDLLDRPVNILSNGQTRRARIAKSLMSRPELLLLDGPFMGLDPPTVHMISSLLRELAEKNAPRLVLSLRPEDHIPEWISHLVVVDESLQITGKGAKKEMLPITQGETEAQPDILSRDGFTKSSPAITPGEAVIEMDGVKVSYGPRTVLGGWQQQTDSIEGPQQGLHWSVKRGQRWGIFGPNGSGKTTLLSLITSDHPQTYSLPIKLFGRSRLPERGERGISIFELQRRIGHSSPEVHSFFPKHLTVRRTLESAWADAPLARPEIDDSARRKIDACLRWFAPELNPSPKSTAYQTLEARHQSSSSVGLEKEIKELVDHGEDLDWATMTTFRDMPFSAQRLTLFIRSIIADQELVILDEAFSGMDEATRDKALLFLSHGETLTHRVASESPSDPSLKADSSVVKSLVSKAGLATMKGLTENQALLVISHSRQDVPGCVREWICLPEPGEGRAPRWGTLKGPLELNPEGWEEVWGTRHGDVNA